jgi:hypothetical protein
MPDGKISLAGIWENRRGLGRGGRGGRAGGEGAGAAAPAQAQAQGAGRGQAPGGQAASGGRGGRGGRGGAPNLTETGIPIATFFNIGQNMEGGTAPMTPWALALRKERMDKNMQDNPDAHCLPIGHMQLHLHPQPRKYIQTQDELTMIWEANYGLRHVFLDGRPAPDNDPVPWWYGYTTGRWEGDTLVATTTHIRDGMWLDVNGTPLTEQGIIIERFRRPSFGYMEIDVTIEDSKAFTKPFTVRVNQQIMVDSELIEFICNENERSSRHYQE